MIELNSVALNKPKLIDEEKKSNLNSLKLADQLLILGSLGAPLIF